MRRHFAGKSLLEVGCGKGLFLERLLAAGFDVTGLDPTYEGSNPRVIREFFTPEVGIRAEGIVLRHVLEHVQDPVAFLAGLREANGGRGTIYIEVPCLDWIASHHAWFDIFYEHVNYFRPRRLRAHVRHGPRGRPFVRRPVPLRRRRPGDAQGAAPAPRRRLRPAAGFLSAIDESRERVRADRDAARGRSGVARRRASSSRS